MVKRAKLVNDLAELVPILQIFSTETYRGVYESLLDGWYTLEELKERFGDGVEEALKVLKHAGMLEAKWRMPSDPKEKPAKEYHVSYTHISANFYSSLKELNEILNVVFMPDDEFEEIVDRVIAEIKAGRSSVQYISKGLGYSQLFVRAVAKRSNRLTLKGQLIEMAKNEEI